MLGRKNVGTAQKRLARPNIFTAQHFLGYFGLSLFVLAFFFFFFFFFVVENFQGSSLKGALFKCCWFAGLEKIFSPVESGRRALRARLPANH